MFIATGPDLLIELSLNYEIVLVEPFGASEFYKLETTFFMF